MFTEKVKDIIEKYMGTRPKLDDTPDTIGMDSLDHVEVIMAIEEKFEIDIPDEAFGDSPETLTIKEHIQILMDAINGEQVAMTARLNR